MLDSLLPKDGITLNHEVSFDSKSLLLLGVVVFVALMAAFASSYVLFKNN